MRPQRVCGLFVLVCLCRFVRVFAEVRRRPFLAACSRSAQDLNIGPEDLPVDQVAQGVNDEQVQLLRAGG